MEENSDVRVAYDYLSIMHYDMYAFAKTDATTGQRLQTIVPNEAGVVITDISLRPYLTTNDVELVQKSYAGICGSGGSGSQCTGKSCKITGVLGWLMSWLSI